MPIPDNFQESVIDIARYELILNLCVLPELRDSTSASVFLAVSLNELLSIYRAQSISRSVTLKMFEDGEGLNECEGRILCYLQQYIGDMSNDELSTFLRFVTGAATCSALKVSVGLYWNYWVYTKTNCTHLWTCTINIVIRHTMSLLRNSEAAECAWITGTV